MKPSIPTLAAVAAVTVTALVLGTTGAVAGSLITCNQIKDNTVSTKDIKNKSIATKDLAPKTVKSLKGKTGPRGLNAWDTIPTGKTVTGYVYESKISGSDLVAPVANINLPAKAPSAPTTYGFGVDDFSETAEDATCTGSFDAPTAPAGQVCVYLDGLGGVTDVQVYPWDDPTVATHAFYLAFSEEATDTPYYYYGVWAYTAA
jgi:hypothetical protein